jgi:exopolysaccharide biosynthesis polyprenyl glycosylphosphotransferase
MLSRRTEPARVALFLVDQGLLAAAFACAFLLKRRWVFPDPDTLFFDVYSRLYLVAMPVIAISLSMLGFYRFRDEILPHDRVRKRDMVMGGGAAVAVLIVIGFLVKPEMPDGSVAPAYSRVLFALFLFTASGALWISRKLLETATARMRDDPAWRTQVLVFGMSTRMLRLLGVLERAPHMNLVVAGVAAERVPPDVGPRIDSARALDLLEQGSVDQVLVETDGLPEGTLDKILKHADREGISVHLTSSMFPATHLLPTWERIGGVPVLGFVSAEMGLGSRITKRAFDVVAACLGLLLISPFLVLIALLIRLDSKGPAFFVQDRVGSRGAVFPMFKFRTMLSDAESGTGPVFATENDNRCTRVGRLLRRWNLDELPQLLNVISGNMSLVGPRPERPEFVKGFKRSIPRYAHKHWVKPGITGWAQIHGLRGASTSLRQRVEHDLYYIENWSLLLDLRILYRTVIDGYVNAA